MQLSETVEAQDELQPFRDSPIVVYDVGARGQLQPHWHEWAQTGHPGAAFVLFEPHPPAADALRDLYRANPQVQVVEAGLYNQDGPFTLNVTRHASCSSLLEPDGAVLSRYNIAGIFEVVSRSTVSCRRMEGIVADMNLPRPDFCKLDVQGAEYDILLGMGDLLQSCLAFEMETHFYPIYKGQKLLSDIVALLQEHGFTLRHLRPQHNFDADYVEANAFFAKREELLPPDSSPRLELIKKKLQLQSWPSGRNIRNKLQNQLMRQARREKALRRGNAEPS